MRTTVLVIGKRFCGPPRSGNGGYACGRVANLLLGCCKVRLKAPPPLDVELRAETMEREARLFDGSALIAEAQLSPLDLLPLRPPVLRRPLTPRSTWASRTASSRAASCVGPSALPGMVCESFLGRCPRDRSSRHRGFLTRRSTTVQETCFRSSSGLHSTARVGFPYRRCRRKGPGPSESCPSE